MDVPECQNQVSHFFEDEGLNRASWASEFWQSLYREAAR